MSIPCAKKCCYSSQLILKYIQYFSFLSVVFEKQISAAFGSVQTEKISAEWFAIDAFTNTWKSTILVPQRPLSPILLNWNWCHVVPNSLPRDNWNSCHGYQFQIWLARSFAGYTVVDFIDTCYNELPDNIWANSTNRKYRIT